MVDLSSRACARVLASGVLPAARCVAIYAPVHGEVDPAVIAAAAMAAHKPVYYPRIVGDDLEFLCAGPQALRLGAYDIPEPPGDAHRLDPEARILVVVPGVAFDLRGARLGRGGGRYDRALTRYPGALRIGLSYEFQMLPLLPEAPWDARMDEVVTEARLVRTGDARPAP